VSAVAGPHEPSRTPSTVARQFDCSVVGRDGVEPCTRSVIEEGPIRLVVNGEPVATLMRTPGSEVELALGFLLSEGLAQSMGDVAAITFCREGELGPAGEVRVQLAGEMRQPIQHRYREVFSSCGLCGLELIEAYADDLQAFHREPGRLRADDVFLLRDAMDGVQALFGQTGGSHGAAVSELPVDAEGRSAVVREDVGRHNALDKAVGAAAGQGLRFERSLLVLSGRLSFEMVAKAARAGLSDVAAVGAPSALGLDLARRLGMFLAGFVRGHTMTVYSGIEALA
jgi:FdhD protein